MLKSTKQGKGFLHLTFIKIILNSTQSVNFLLCNLKLYTEFWFALNCTLYIFQWQFYTHHFPQVYFSSIPFDFHKSTLEAKTWDYIEIQRTKLIWNQS